MFICSNFLILCLCGENSINGYVVNCFILLAVAWRKLKFIFFFFVNSLTFSWLFLKGISVMSVICQFTVRFENKYLIFSKRISMMFCLFNITVIDLMILIKI